MDRDSRPNYEFMNASYERRSGSGDHSTAPAALLERDYPVWRARLREELLNARARGVVPSDPE